MVSNGEGKALAYYIKFFFSTGNIYIFIIIFIFSLFSVSWPRKEFQDTYKSFNRRSEFFIVINIVASSL